MKWPRVMNTRRGRLDFGELDAVARRFIRYVRPHRWALVAAGFATLGAVAAQIAAPWPIKLIFDLVLSDAMASSWVGSCFATYAPSPQAALAVICGLVLLFAVADAAFVYLRDVLLARTGQEVVGKLRHDLFRHLSRLGPDVLKKRRTGDLIMRLTGDIQMLRQMLVNSGIRAGETILSALATIAIMFCLDWKLAAVSTATLPVMIVFGTRVSKRIRHATKSQRERESEVATIAHEVIGAMMVVQAFNRERIELQRFARQNRGSIRAGLRTTKLESQLYRTVSLSAAVGLCAVLYLGVRAVLSGAMTAGDLLLFAAYYKYLLKPLLKMTRLASVTAKATACGLRIAEIFDIPPDVTDTPHALAAHDIQGRIELRDVSFVYPDGSPALRHVSCSIEPHERVAIVGRSGVGKSTLIKLLLRFYDPTSGQILLDGTDIREFTLESLRDQIAIAHQDTVLFGLTIEENIAFAAGDVDRAAVRRVARKVGADAFIKALPDGYDTRLGERGDTLSGGQRQRLALARAILRPTPVLILDEPVTGLDATSARVAEQTWLNGDRGRTTVVVCHDLAHAEQFDRLIVLDEGRIVDSGRHDELRERCEIYAKLYEAWQERRKWSELEECGVHAN